MKEVLILGNSNNRLSYYDAINKWKGEIWVCNKAFLEHEQLPRLNRVFSVHKENSIYASEYKKENKLNYEIYASQDIPEFKDIIKLTKYRGWSTGNEAIHQAMLEDYKVFLVGFDFGVGGDIYQPGKELVGSNFIKQYNSLLQEYGKEKIKLVTNESQLLIEYKKDEGRKKIVTKNIDEVKRVVIVGNSPEIFSHEYGPMIDSFDYIVRINDYTTMGYEKYVGTKTNCWITGAGHQTKIKGRNIDYMDCIVTPGITQFKSPKKFLQEKIQTTLGIDNPKMKILEKETIQNIHKELGLKYASTGIMAIAYFAFILKKEVTIIGFDFFQKHKNHYYNKQKAKISPSHNFIKENKIVHLYTLLGKIKTLDVTSAPIIGKPKNLNLEMIKNQTTASLIYDLNKDHVNDLSKTALFSLITDPFYEQFVVMIKSFLKHNPWFDLDYLILDLGISKEIKDKMKNIYPKIKFIKVASKDKLYYDKVNMSLTDAKLKNTFYKLELFNIKGYDKVIMIDVDMLITGDMSGVIFDKRQGILACKCYNEQKKNLSSSINSGLVIATKEVLNYKVYTDLLKIAQTGFNLPDQKVINQYFKNSFKYLDKKYNVEKRMWDIIKNNPFVKKEDIRVLHFVGAKPMDLDKPPRDRNYEDVEKYWHKFYKELKRKEVL